MECRYVNQHSPTRGTDEPEETGRSGGSEEATGTEGADEADVSGEAAGADAQASARLSTVFSAIADDHRRAVLRAASRAEAGELPLDDLVVAVDDAVHSGEEEGVDEQRRHRVRTTLHHNHLPKLEASGLIEYESGPGTVRVIQENLQPDVFGVIGVQTVRD